MNVETVAVVCAVLFGGLALFQMALVFGAPAGNIVFGGRVADADGRLPSKWRAVSGIAAVALLGFAWVVLARAGVVATSIDQRYLSVATWAIVAYMAINSAANFASKNAIERYVMGGASLVLVVLCSFVAASGPT
jgi:hypothetical protein